MNFPQRVAFLGLGRMGRPMAANIAHAGFQVVVYNRTHSIASAFAEDYRTATVAESPREAAGAADVVITMLADEEALRNVYEGPHGLLAGWSPGKIAVDMGTTGPAGTAWLASAIQQAGGSAVDAPVSGAVRAAESGQLTLMVGGPPGTVDTIRPILESVSTTTYYLGGSGAGSVMKLAVNNVIYALGQAVSESLVLAERAGIDRAHAYDVFCNSAIAAPMVKYRYENYVHPTSSDVQCPLTMAAKDLDLIAKLAAEVNAPMPQATLNLSTTVDAIASGLGEQDMAAIAVHLRHQPVQRHPRSPICE